MGAEGAGSPYRLSPAALWLAARPSGVPDWLAGGGGGGGVPPGEKAAEAHLGVALIWDESAEREVSNDGGATRLVWGQIITVYSFRRNLHPSLVAMETSPVSMNAWQLRTIFHPVCRCPSEHGPVSQGSSIMERYYNHDYFGRY